MADYSFSNLNSAIDLSDSTKDYKIQTTDSFVVEVSNGTVSIGNLDLTLDTTQYSSPPRLRATPPRRSRFGQLYPRF